MNFEEQSMADNLGERSSKLFELFTWSSRAWDWLLRGKFDTEKFYFTIESSNNEHPGAVDMANSSELTWWFLSWQNKSEKKSSCCVLTLKLPWKSEVHNLRRKILNIQATDNNHRTENFSSHIFFPRANFLNPKTFDQR